jgi:3-hydroxyacyl-CoA dehydrogenase
MNKDLKEVLSGRSAKKMAEVKVYRAGTKKIYMSNVEATQRMVNAVDADFIIPPVVEKKDAKGNIVSVTDGTLTPAETAFNERKQKSRDFLLEFQRFASGIDDRD